MEMCLLCVKDNTQVHFMEREGKVRRKYKETEVLQLLRSISRYRFLLQLGKFLNSSDTTLPN